MLRKISDIISYKIESKYEEWVKIFESEEADLRYYVFDIKPLFRVFCKNDPKKIILLTENFPQYH